MRTPCSNREEDVLRLSLTAQQIQDAMDAYDATHDGGYRAHERAIRAALEAALAASGSELHEWMGGKGTPGDILDIAASGTQPTREQMRERIMHTLEHYYAHRPEGMGPGTALEKCTSALLALYGKSGAKP